MSVVEPGFTRARAEVRATCGAEGRGKFRPDTGALSGRCDWPALPNPGTFGAIWCFAEKMMGDRTAKRVTSQAQS